MRINLIKKICIFFLIFSSFSYSSSVDDMKNKIKVLDTEKKTKNERIENINVEKKEISKQIESIKEDIKKVSEERDKITEEIKVVSKNIDYGKRNLNFNSHELQRKKALFDAKIIAWSKREKVYKSFEDKYILKKEYSRILKEDLERIKKIENVQKDILIVKADIEKEKNKLSSLNFSLKRKQNEIDRKIKRKNELISKLNSEKRSHIKRISNIEKEKKRIEKQIEAIIKNRTVIQKDVKLNDLQRHLGKAMRPISGITIVNFNEIKTKNVRSNGIEIKGSLGREIKASLPGKVIYIDTLQGLGKVIMIDYGYNTIGVYGNTLGPKVKINQRVKKGEVIGVLGYSTDKKPVLYYEVRFNLKPINPEKLF